MHDPFQLKNIRYELVFQDKRLFLRCLHALKSLSRSERIRPLIGKADSIVQKR